MDHEFFPWWKKCSREISKQLWIPKTQNVLSPSYSNEVDSNFVRVVKQSPCCITEVISIHQSELSIRNNTLSLPVFPPYSKQSDLKYSNNSCKPPALKKYCHRHMDKDLLNPKSLKVRLYPSKHIKEKWNKYKYFN